MTTFLVEKYYCVNWAVDLYKSIKDTRVIYKENILVDKASHTTPMTILLF